MKNHLDSPPSVYASVSSMRGINLGDDLVFGANRSLLHPGPLSRDSARKSIPLAWAEQIYTPTQAVQSAVLSILAFINDVYSQLSWNLPAKMFEHAELERDQER